MGAPHILISGAGIGGLTVATVLAQQGARVEVFEQSSTFGEVGAGIQQSPNAMAVHTAIGTATAIAERGFEPKAGVLRDYKTGRALLTTPLATPLATPMSAVYEPRYNYQYLHIHRADLHAILRSAATKAGVILHSGMRVTGYSQDTDQVNLMANGQGYTGDILIGADGINSTIRETMLGPADAAFTDHVAWRGTVATSKLPTGTIPPDANNWLGPDQHFVSYYLRGGAQINFVAVQKRHAWTEESWTKPGDMADLRRTFTGWDPRVTALLEACETSYLWGLFDRPPLSHWVDNRVALMGDAAHPMLPFMAQGSAMAIEDAWVLGQSILTHNGNPAQALKTYETARYDRATMIQGLSRNNAALFHAKSPVKRFIRDTKFKIATSIQPLLFSRLDKIYGVDVVKDYPLRAQH